MDRQLKRTASPGAALAGLALSACIIGIPAPEPSPPPGRSAGSVGAAAPDGCPSTEGHELLTLVNEMRREHGLGPLLAEERLVRAAISHTADQAARNRGGVTHVGSDGSAPGDRMRAAGYEWRLGAENVAGGIASAPAVVGGWMNSPPHRATILSPDAVHAGVGYVFRLDGRFRHYWTLVVAAPLEAGDAQLLACHP